jgi:hypothetical protein
MLLVLNTMDGWGQIESRRGVDLIQRTPKNAASTNSGFADYLDYYGGPVISNVQVLTIFWGPNVYPAVTTGIGNFFQSVTNSDYYDLLSEYDTSISSMSGHAGTSQSIGRGTFGGSYTITPSICSVTPCALTDAQVQAELLAQVNTAQIPPPQLDLYGNVNTLYMLYFPAGVAITKSGMTSCVDYCAYHGTTANTFNSKNLAYGVMPDFTPPNSCNIGCGTLSAFLNLTVVTSHELAEAVTDPDIGIASTFAYPVAWIEPGLGEIADVCGHIPATIQTSGGPLTVQQLWSNKQNACVSATGPANPPPPELLSYFPVSINYGANVVGTSLVKTEKLTNTTTISVFNISSITITGVNAGEFNITKNSCTRTLSFINRSCTLSVAFTPRARGNRTASLVVTDNAGNSPQIISLTGTGK